MVTSFKCRHIPYATCCFITISVALPFDVLGAATARIDVFFERLISISPFTIALVVSPHTVVGHRVSGWGNRFFAIVFPIGVPVIVPVIGVISCTAIRLSPLIYGLYGRVASIIILYTP